MTDGARGKHVGGIDRLERILSQQMIPRTNVAFQRNQDRSRSWRRPVSSLVNSNLSTELFYLPLDAFMVIFPAYASVQHSRIVKVESLK